MIFLSPGTGEEWPWIHVVMFSQHTIGNGNVFHVRPNVGHRPRLSPSYPTTSSLPSSCSLPIIAFPSLGYRNRQYHRVIDIPDTIVRRSLSNSKTSTG